MKSMTSLMGRILVLLLLIISTTLGFSSDPAQAGILDNITKVYDSAKSGGKQYFCGKADVTSGTFSVRSFQGELCSNSRTIAALSEYVCTNPNTAGFEGSQCDTKAKQQLGGADPLTVVKQEAKSATGVVLSLIKLFVPL